MIPDHRFRMRKEKNQADDPCQHEERKNSDQEYAQPFFSAIAVFFIQENSGQQQRCQKKQGMIAKSILNFTSKQRQPRTGHAAGRTRNAEKIIKRTNNNMKTFVKQHGCAEKSCQPGCGQCLFQALPGTYRSLPARQGPMFTCSGCLLRPRPLACPAGCGSLFIFGRRYGGVVGAGCAVCCGEAAASRSSRLR